jgi:asparagine synthase (glutamine-hydrolysing)
MELDHLVLTYNGEIYNHRRLREEYDGPFRSETDSEVVLHAYREHGPDCVHSFRGMFAFAIWDQERRRVFAARDRLGIKPLYYRPLDGAFAFASETAPLLDLAPAEIDYGALADYLTYGYVPAPKTGWHGIYKLGAAERLAWDAEGLRIERYWRPPTTEVPMGIDEASGQLEDLLGEIVPEHTLADVPVGVFLSGGLDSATVASYLDRCSTFTLGQPETGRDEAGAARDVALHLGTDHHEEVATVPDLEAAVDAMVGVFGEPFGDSAALSVWLLSRMTRRHVTVALSGEGGDEIFCGYRWYGQAMAGPTAFFRVFRSNRLGTFTGGGRSWQRRASQGLERYGSFVCVFTSEQVRGLRGPRLQACAEEDPLWNLRRYWRPELPLHRRLQWCDMNTYLPDDLLNKIDRASMAFSLEVRPPLLDHRLVEWALSCPVEVLRDNATDRGKHVLRKLIEPRLPDGHFDRPKRGFNLAIGRWARRSPAVFREALERLEAHGMIHRPRVFLPANEQVWSLLMLDRWLLRHERSYGADATTATRVLASARRPAG